MEKQKRINDSFNVVIFIEELMEEERTGVKKVEKNVIEENVDNLEDDLPINIQNKLRDQEIQSWKKEYQEQKLQPIEVEKSHKLK
jgi:hypothetical protein